MIRHPTINQYIDSLNYGETMFRSIADLKPDKDAYGCLSFSAGNYAAVFKCSSQEKEIAVKCYLRPTNDLKAVYDYIATIDSPYIVSAQYIPDEIYVYDECDNGSYYGITTMEWIEGETLGHKIASLCYTGDRDQLADLAKKFDVMSLWLLSQDFAHGDLKFDNIIVSTKGELRLIDLDGIYIPQAPRSLHTILGSPDFQHPARDRYFFNSHIDDYPIALISTTLHTLAQDPGLYAHCSNRESPIFNPAQTFNGKSDLLNTLTTKWLYSGELALVRLSKMLQNPTPALESIYEGIAAVEGQKAKQTQFTIIDQSDPNLIIVRSEGLFGWIDGDRNIVIEPVYSDATPFSEGVAAVRSGDHKMFIDISGRCVIACNKYSCIGSFREGLARVVKDGLYGFIDLKREEIIEPKYQFASNFRQGVAIVKINDKFGYINIAGDEIIHCKYDNVEHFKNGIAAVNLLNKEYKIDMKGNIII